jgi:hypothetical protein
MYRDKEIRMKTLIVCICVVFYSTAIVGQTSGAQPDRSEAEKTVAILLGDDGHAPIPGFVATLVNRLGDGAAVGIIQYLGERKISVSEDSTSPEELRRILVVIKISFEVPSIIEAKENRTPKATLILLNYLDSLPAARAVKSELESANKFVEQSKLDALVKSTQKN